MTEEQKRIDRLHEAIFTICDHFWDGVLLASLANDLDDIVCESGWRAIVPPQDYVYQNEDLLREYKTKACNRIADAIVFQFYPE